VSKELRPILIDLVVAAANEDRDRLRESILGGDLFQRPVILFLPSLLPTYCGMLATSALGGAPVSLERTMELFPMVKEIARAMPVDLDGATLSKWLRLSTGVDAFPSPAMYQRPEDFDLVGVCAPMATAGAATVHAGWGTAQLGRYYDAMRKAVEHSARLTASWAR
jgi:hypothetical protein